MEYSVEMLGITKKFKKNIANDNVDFRLRKGSIHGLLGENGAGKTTLMNVLYGLYKPEEGVVKINGKEEVIDSPTKAMSLGIGMVHQHFMLVRNFSVLENVMLGTKSRRGPLLDKKRIAAELTAVSKKYKLEVDIDAKIWQLSVGEQQRVEILSAVYQGAEILILDEPTAVLTPQESEELFDILRIMRDNGKSIILITHKLDEILSIVDEVTVLRDGKFVGNLMMSNEVTKETLTQMMVGREILFEFMNEELKPSGETLLSLCGICANNNKDVPALKNLNLEIKSGEILGLAGVDGNGQKELAEVMTGLRKCTAGEILFEGENIANLKPAKYIEKKIAHIPEDRLVTGVAGDLSIKNNLIIKNYNSKKFAKRWIINYVKVNNHAMDVMQEFKIKATSRNELVKDLSGGNQQKVVLARELHGKPKVLIASHPTRGLDIGASEYVRGELLHQRNKGVGVLLVSADLEEILQLSDRIAVIYDGQIMGILPRGADVHEIGKLMLGSKLEEEKVCAEN